MREKVGKAADDFAKAYAEDGGNAAAWLCAFCVKQFGAPADGRPVPKHQRQFVYRCRKMVLGPDYAVGKLTKGEKSRPGSMRKAWWGRRRRHGLQGRPKMMPSLGLLLYQWFVDIRSSVKGRLKRRIVLAEARSIRRTIVEATVKQGLAPPPQPNIDHTQWLKSWQRNYGISIKHPTRKFKVSHGKCKRRCRNVTLNMCVARLAFALLYGGSNECDVSGACRCRCATTQFSDGRVGCRRSRGLPVEPMIVSLDQKGVLYNNSESKNTTTMHSRGSKQPVDLKTNHAQSRARLSLCTCMALRAPWRIPPLGMNFKGKTPRVLNGLKIPAKVPMILTQSPSGSYNAETFLRYLDDLLPPWTPEREAALDYGILMLDAYTVHKMDAVADLARERGFIIVFHEGGITGITQWNDLDCHAQIEARMIQLEEEDFHKQLLKRPHRVPSRDRQTLLSDSAAIWATFAHHTQTAKSAVRSGLGNELPERRPDGHFSHFADQDHLVTREAADFWQENNIPVLRAQNLERVYAAVQSGKLTSWQQVPEYFLPPDDPHDDHIEGQEIDLYDPHLAAEVVQEADSDAEGGAAEDHAPNAGDDSDGSSEEAAHSGAPAAGSAASAEPSELSAELPLAEPVSDESALLKAEGTPEMAAGLAARLAHYDEAITFASAQLQDELLAKQIRDRKVEFWRVVRHVDKAVITAASAEMKKQREALEQLRSQIREEDALREKEKKQRRDAERQRKEKAAQEKAAEQERHALYMTLDRPWNPKDFGQGDNRLTAKAAKNITEALERCRGRAPPLSRELDAMWEMFLDRYPAHLREKKAGSMGIYFVNRMNRLKEELGRHYKRHPDAGGSSSRSAASAGRADAFAEFVRAELSELVGRLTL